MSMIWRRKRTTADTTEPPVDDGLPALTAASATISPEKWGKVVKSSPEAGKWQGEAWGMLDLVGELSFAVLWKTALLSRFRLVASDIDPETGKPTGTTENADARQLVQRIAGGATGQSQMLGRLAPLLMFPGEGWLVIIFPGGEEQWHVLSSDEVKARGDTVELTLPDGTRYVMNQEIDTLARIWRPHPRVSTQATSPVKAALPILREIVRMTQNIEGAGKSRQAGNGIIVIPEEVSISSNPAPTGAIDPDAPGLPSGPAPSRFVSADELRIQLQEAMSTAIADPSSAAALVPIIVKVKGEYVDKIRHIRFDSEVSDKAQEAREKAIRRLAMTLDMPAEVLLGLADLNHWSLYGVEEEAVRWHAKPDMEIICASLTNELLRPILPEFSGVIWYDTSDVDAEPDKKEIVRTAYTDGVATAATYLREAGMNETDGYDLTKREGWVELITDQVRRDATLIPTLAPVLRAMVPALQLPEAMDPTPAIAAPPPQEDGPEAPARTPDTRDDETEVVASASAVVRLCVNEALRLAGKRSRGRADHARLRGVPARDTHLHNHLGPVSPSEVPRLIEGWEEIVDPEVCASAGVSLDQLRTVVASVSRDALTTGTRPMWGPDQ